MMMISRWPPRLNEYVVMAEITPTTRSSFQGIKFENRGGPEGGEMGGRPIRRSLQKGAEQEACFSNVEQGVA